MDPSPRSQLLLAINKMMGNNTDLFLRTIAALCATLPVDMLDTPITDCYIHDGSPGPAYLKVMAGQLGAALGIISSSHLSTSREAIFGFIGACRVTRKRFHDIQRFYVEMGTRPDAPPMLTLACPARNPDTWHEWLGKQACSHDDHRDVYYRGLRVNADRLASCPYVPSDLRRYLRTGFPLLWTGRPGRHRGRNYASCAEHGNASAVDFDRLHAAGWVEGPLQYTPWTTNSIACVIKFDPFKVRNVVDFARSGVNDHLARVPCYLDDLTTVVPQLRRGDGLAKIDLADAFFCWPNYVGDCDYQAFRHPVTQEWYRYRFYPFGHRQAPALAQRWARVIQSIISREGLQFCRPDSPEGMYANITAIGAYLDDFLLRFHSTLTLWQQYLAYFSIVRTLQLYGFPVKAVKCEWPATQCEYVGVSINTLQGTLIVTPARCAKLLAVVQHALPLATATGQLTRGVLASCVGKLQWCCVVLPECQAYLMGLYKARDSLLTAGVSPPTARWEQDALCSVDTTAISELRWWHALLQRSCCPLTYFQPITSELPPLPALERTFMLRSRSFLWGRAILPELPGDDALAAFPSADFETVTSDASGLGGGAHWRHIRLRYNFSAEELAGRLGTSSNLRELYMVPWTLFRIGHHLQGRRVLFRLDNTAAVGAVNKGGSMVPEVNILLRNTHLACRMFGIQVVARHIPGVDNQLADALSRLPGTRDDQDWQLLPSVFHRLEHRVGPFQVDACADPLGHNAYCPSYWSHIDSCRDHSWAGLDVYCNPPFAEAAPILSHFWSCYQELPFATSATFVLPTWTSAPWWRQLAGAMVVAYFRRGHTLFTRPRWEEATASNPVPIEREYEGPTRWGVVLIHLPRALPHRSPAGRLSRLPRLSGHPLRDEILLSRLPDGFMPNM